jgi:hypothetical protein
MDEEDGRPGPLAATPGHPDALTDALPESLRFAAHSHPSDHLSARTAALAALLEEEGRGCCPGMAQRVLRFSGAEAPHIFIRPIGTTEVVPFHKARSASRFAKPAQPEFSRGLLKQPFYKACSSRVLSQPVRRAAMRSSKPAYPAPLQAFPLTSSFRVVMTPSSPHYQGEQHENVPGK